MLSRALSSATVTLLIGCFATAPAWAQATNLEAGKSPSQIFAGTCTACHKGPRGLLKTVSPGSLGGFLRQHYTTSPEMASLLAGYLVSNGASDRTGGNQPKQGKDEKQEANRPGAQPEQLDRFGRRMRPAAPSQEAARPDATKPESAKPDADGRSPQAEPGRAAKRLARPGEPPEAGKPADGQVPAQAAIERGPDGRKLTAKQKLGRHGKPAVEEPPKADTVREEPAKGEPEKDDKPNNETTKNESPKNESPKSEPSKSESAKVDTGKPEATKPESNSPAVNTSAGEGKSETKTEAPKDAGSAEKPALRADPVPPVPPVTPAAPAAPAASTAASSAPPEPAARPSAPEPAPPAVTASAPPPPPPPAAGPPEPPISQ